MVIIEDLLGPGGVVQAWERRRAKGRRASPTPFWPGLFAAHTCKPGPVSGLTAGFWNLPVSLGEQTPYAYEEDRKGFFFISFSPSAKGTDFFLSLRVEELKYNNYSR